MKKFIATCKNTGNKIEIDAADINYAAKEAAMAFNKTKKSVVACRVTGTPGMGGCFQAYTTGNPQAAVGYLFKVSEA